MFWDDFRQNYSDIGALLFRVVFGGLFLLHGLDKFGIFSDKSFGALPGMIQTAAVIEVVTGLFIVLGLLTTWASFLASGTMAVAYWTKHAGLNPLTSGGEAAVLYTFAFLLIWFYGAGPYSLDAKMQK